MLQQGGNRERDVEFEHVFMEYKKMIHHLIHKYHIQDPQGEFFQEGMIALWDAYQRYGDRDTFGKMAYITIRSRLIDLIRKKNRRADKMKRRLILSVNRLIRMNPSTHLIHFSGSESKMH